MNEIEQSVLAFAAIIVAFVLLVFFVFCYAEIRQKIRVYIYKKNIEKLNKSIKKYIKQPSEKLHKRIIKLDTRLRKQDNKTGRWHRPGGNYAMDLSQLRKKNG